jgi:heptosyltransferase-2
VLLVAVNWLGDLVMSVPAMRAVRRAYPAASVSVVVRSELASFFDGVDWIDELLPYERRRERIGVRAYAILGAALRARRFDLAVLFPNNFESALLAALGGVPNRVGYRRDARGPLLTRGVRPEPRDLARHQSGYFLAMLERTLGIEGSEQDCSPGPISGAHLATMREILASRRQPGSPLVALAVGAAFGPAKEWPAARYAALIDLLAERHGAECVLVGAPREAPACERVAAASGAGAMVLAGHTTVAQAMALLTLCDAFVGNDSGSMHLAGALGLPTVGIFGSSDPSRTAPLGPRTRALYHPIECSPCLARTCRFGHYRCLSEIAPEDVLRALGELGAFA